MKELSFPEPIDDGRVIPVVGEHSKFKHYFLQRYMHAFTTAMRKNWKWLFYVDLFAGAGIERLEDSGRLTWGSPLIAAQIEPAFDRLFLCELDFEKRAALKWRLGRVRRGDCDVVEQGDANSLAMRLVGEIPTRSLTLAFLDPYGLHLSLETIRTLFRLRCDLVIFFPDRVDFMRNWRLNYLDQDGSNPDIVLGSDSNWRAIVDKVPQAQVPEVIRELYVSQIRKIGFRYFEYERISSARGNPLYQLIFCSEHELGAGIWRRVAKTKPDKQTTFDFGNPDE